MEPRVGTKSISTRPALQISHHKVHETFLTWLSVKQETKNETLCDGNKLHFTRHVASPLVRWCELEQHHNHIGVSAQTEKSCWLAYVLSIMHGNVVKHYVMHASSM